MYCIYLLYNKINGKIYVGKTKDFDQRWKDHLKIAQGGKEKYHNSHAYIHSAINKYGSDNFLHKIVADNIIDEEVALHLEKQWISVLKLQKYTLYNLTDGGDGVSGRKSTSEQRKAQSERQKGSIPWNKGRETPEKMRKKQSIAALNRFKKEIHPRLGKPSHFKGKQRSKEFGEKISKAKKGIPKSREHILATSKLKEEQVKEIKKLIQDGVPNNIIAEKFGVYRDTISRIKNKKTWSWIE